MQRSLLHVLLSKGEHETIEMRAIPRASVRTFAGSALATPLSVHRATVFYTRRAYHLLARSARLLAGDCQVALQAVGDFVRQNGTLWKRQQHARAIISRCARSMRNIADLGFPRSNDAGRRRSCRRYRLTRVRWSGRAHVGH